VYVCMRVHVYWTSVIIRKPNSVITNIAQVCTVCVKFGHVWRA
jgi:hypothetical protein